MPGPELNTLVRAVSSQRQGKQAQAATDKPNRGKKYGRDEKLTPVLRINADNANTQNWNGLMGTD